MFAWSNKIQILSFAAAKQLLCGVFLLGSTVAHGATLYVDPAGADGSPGSSTLPWQTIQHAAESVVPGDTVIVRAGVYVESVLVSVSGTPASPILFQAEPGAVLECPNPAASLSAFAVATGVGHVEIDGFEARGGYHETILLRDDTHDIVLRNLDLHHNRAGIWVAGSNNVEIDGCSLHENTVHGLRVLADSNGVVVRNTISSGHDDGLGCDGNADGFVVEETASNVTFESCIAESNGEDGFDIQGDAVTLARCVSRDNTCTGVKMSQNGRIENALIVGNTAGVLTTSLFALPTTIEILNSTIADNDNQQIHAQSAPDPNGVPMEYSLLVRNVIARGPGKAIEAERGVLLTSDHNLLFRDSTAERVIVLHTETGQEFYSGQQINEGVWQVASGQGAGTWAMLPDFVDTVDYRVDATSAAREGGDAMSAPTDDLVGAMRPLGLANDIGAYEETGVVVNRRPWPEPGPDRWGVAGDPITFNSYGTADPDGDPLAYAWDFGDGTEVGTDVNPTHTYAVAGVFPLTLTVSDGELERSRAAVVEISPAPTATPTSTPTVTPTPTDTPTITPTPTMTPTPTPKLDHDAVLYSVRALKVKVSAAKPFVTKKVSLKVRNANDRAFGGVHDFPVRLTVDDGDCPAGTVSAADFERSVAGAQDTSSVRAGGTESASLEVFVDASRFTTVNHKVAARCTFRVTATVEVAGNVDPTPANNVALVELNVFDRDDVPVVTVGESYVESVKPLGVKIRDGDASASQVVKFRVGNGDIVPVWADPGHAITVVADDGTCPPGTLGTPDFSDEAGIQNPIVVRGGRREKGTVEVSLDAAAVHSPSRKSPARCVAYLSVVGTGSEGDTTNDRAEVVIEIADYNDF